MSQENVEIVREAMTLFGYVRLRIATDDEASPSGSSRSQYRWAQAQDR